MNLEHVQLGNTQAIVLFYHRRKGLLKEYYEIFDLHT